MYEPLELVVSNDLDQNDADCPLYLLVFFHALQISKYITGFSSDGISDDTVEDVIRGRWKMIFMALLGRGK